MDNTVPVRHIKCGFIVMFYDGPRDNQRMRSQDVTYMDGTRPEPNSVIPLCKHCGESLASNLIRSWDEAGRWK